MGLHWGERGAAMRGAIWPQGGCKGDVTGVQRDGAVGCKGGIQCKVAARWLRWGGEMGRPWRCKGEMQLSCNRDARGNVVGLPWGYNRGGRWGARRR